MNFEWSDFKRAVLDVVQPLYKGTVDDATGSTGVKLTDVVPLGSADNYQRGQPFGFVSTPVKGVRAFFSNLLGSALAPVIVAEIHKTRPAPAAGEVTVYSTSPDGATVKVSIALKNDGTLVVTTPVKVQVVAPDVELGDGTLEKVLNGETFQTFFNQHKHVCGVPGSFSMPPAVLSDSSHLSEIVKAAK